MNTPGELIGAIVLALIMYGIGFIGGYGLGRDLPRDVPSQDSK